MLVHVGYGSSGKRRMTRLPGTRDAQCQGTGNAGKPLLVRNKGVSHDHHDRTGASLEQALVEGNQYR